jgi:hypothetical protein
MNKAGTMEMEEEEDDDFLFLMDIVENHREKKLKLDKDYLSNIK